MGLDNPVHLILLLLVILLIFGAKRLPEIGRSLGEGMRGFKDSLTGADAPPAQPPLTAAAPPPAATQPPVPSSEEPARVAE